MHEMMCHWNLKRLCFTLHRLSSNYNVAKKDWCAMFKTSRAGEPAKSLRAPFDSHYVCIGRDGYQCVDGLRARPTTTSWCSTRAASCCQRTASSFACEPAAFC